MKVKRIHIGNLISEKLTLQERNAGWLARHIGMEESACRKMLKRHKIDTERMQDICCAMSYDFFTDLSHSLE
ncbi:MAG: hypothetical protein LBN95_03690 [Prevotellaceae bacterium]|jgi:hypothetical protein|nr:hypothetical protein [Prevotellaceae bacterium]